ncbi:MAG: hypothetical protein K9J17_17100 [Flavobacteriales bacterium]|nr:hypothetical protein [Flavobacteriales bacterium]
MKEDTSSYALPKSVKRHAASELPDLKNLVKVFANTQNSNPARVAKAMGVTSSNLNDRTKGRNPRIEMLLALSEALEYNLLDFYLRLLPERLRSTTETRQLEQQIEELQAQHLALKQELESTTRERDLLFSLMQAPRK